MTVGSTRIDVGALSLSYFVRTDLSTCATRSSSRMFARKSVSLLLKRIDGEQLMWRGQYGVACPTGTPSRDCLRRAVAGT
jgi:hypothetical protein